MRDRIAKIVEHWFLAEPVLFAIYCTHKLTENSSLNCLFRTGQKRIEFNPNSEVSDPHLEESLRLEIMRILLKHPYERRLEYCRKQALSLASYMVIDQHYRLKFQKTLQKAHEFQLPVGECFEWYAQKLSIILSTENLQSLDESQQSLDESQQDSNDSLSGSNDSQQNPDKSPFDTNEWSSLGEQSELWDEDPLAQEDINDIIRKTTSWGTLPNDIVETIKANLIPKLDYRKILRSFHTSILSSKRRLTQMYPSRRFGFLQMGSRYDFKSRLLIGVDVSGSVSSENLRKFYSAIARFFKYGVETIDVSQFDADLKELQTFKKASKTISITGRGGTNFQPIFDYLKAHNSYDGLIIFTDGYAPVPSIDFIMRAKVLWVCNSKKNYEQHKEWMQKTGKSCWVE